MMTAKTNDDGETCHLVIHHHHLHHHHQRHHHRKGGFERGGENEVYQQLERMGAVDGDTMAGRWGGQYVGEGVYIPCGREESGRR